MVVNNTVFQINENLSLEFDGRNTAILVNGSRFLHCKRLLVDIPLDKAQIFDCVNSIDELSRFYKYYLFENEVTEEDEEKQLVPTAFTFEIAPEDEFWGHCSNLQAWYENNYDTRIIHSNLAFPLLKELARVGDPKAKKAFKDEIAKALCRNYYPTIKFLIVNRYLSVLSVEELLSVVETFKENCPQPSYFKLITKIAAKWSDYISALKEDEQRIVELTSAFAFVNGLLSDPEMMAYSNEYFLDHCSKALNKDQREFFIEYGWICSRLCDIYEKNEQYNDVIDHCKSVLEHNENMFFLWDYLANAYEKIGLPDYASLARKIFRRYEKREKKVYKKNKRNIKRNGLRFKLRIRIWGFIWTYVFLHNDFWEYYLKRLEKKRNT